MDGFTRGMQNVGIFLVMCGCLQAVTITPLPYKENREARQRQIQGDYRVNGLAKITIDEKPVTGFEPGFRIPRGTATFLDQEEGVRIRREMLGNRGSPGFWGGNDDRRGGYDDRRGGYDDRRGGYDERRNFDNYDRNRYYGNEIDRDTFYDKRSNEFLYYPNYNPEPSASNRRDYECDPRGKPYNGYRGSSGGRGYENNGYRGEGRRDYDDRDYGYNNNRGRRYNDDRNGNQPRQDDNRGDQWNGRRYNNGKGNYDARDKDDTIGEGTVGFYGRARRP